MQTNHYPRLRDMREDCDFSQKQISEILGMKEQQYHRYEKGLRDIPTPVLVALAALYNTSTDYLLSRTNNPAPPQK